VVGRTIFSAPDAAARRSEFFAAADKGAAGNAGNVFVSTGSLLVFHGGTLGVQADDSNAGTLTVHGNDIAVENGLLLARSAGRGGNIRLFAGDRLLLQGSRQVTARAGGDGGAITIASPVTVLKSSTIDGRAGGTPVIVRISGDLLSEDSLIRTNTPRSFPTVDLAGSLVALPAAFPSAASPLPDVCGIKLGGQVSSFVVTGTGGLPPEPSGWSPDTTGSAPGDGPDWNLRLGR